jgi:hypothetical protein
MPQRSRRKSKLSHKSAEIKSICRKNNEIKIIPHRKFKSKDSTIKLN